MQTKTLSFCQGKGSLTHNNREFIAKNVDSSRTPDNITFVCEPIAEAYDKCFAGAVERYNVKQKRKDRKIGNYFEHTFKHPVCNTVVTAADKRKSFYEDVVQIGTMHDTGVGTEDAAMAKICLTQYMEGFRKRNPNFYVFNAVLHMDEATPHLHIDYIPIGHYTRGLDTQNGEAKALEEMGFGVGRNAIARWRERERKVLVDICRRNGIIISEPKESRGSYTVEEYKQIQQEITRLTKKLDALDSAVHAKQDEHDRLLQYVPDRSEWQQRSKELDELTADFTALLSKPIARLTHKDDLLEMSSRLVALADLAQQARHHAEAAHMVSSRECTELKKEKIDLQFQVRRLTESLEKSKDELQESRKLLNAVKRLDSDLLERAERHKNDPEPEPVRRPETPVQRPQFHTPPMQTIPHDVPPVKPIQPEQPVEKPEIHPQMPEPKQTEIRVPEPEKAPEQPQQVPMDSFRFTR